MSSALKFAKGVKGSTLKRRRTQAKHANIADVRDQVEALDGERCRISSLLVRFGFYRLMPARLELAHIAARGMGGNPSLSRDTVENTVLVYASLHQGGKYTMHGGYIRVELLTEKGARGPVAITFYEQLPTDIQ